MQVKSFAEYSKGSILQYFQLSVVNIFILSIFSGCFTQVLLFVYSPTR